MLFIFRMNTFLFRMNSISRTSSEGLLFKGLRTSFGISTISILSFPILSLLSSLAVKEDFSALTHGSGHWDADLWWDSPFLNLWLLLLDLQIDLLHHQAEQRQKEDKQCFCTPSPRGASSYCFSGPNTPPMVDPRLQSCSGKKRQSLTLDDYTFVWNLAWEMARRVGSARLLQSLRESLRQ